MSNFPALIPSARIFTPGSPLHLPISVLNSDQIRVSAGTCIIDQRLRLTFLALTELEMLSIRSHYIDQQGSFLAFAIPDDLLAGMATPASFTPSNYNWIYANQPQVLDAACGKHDVTVELITDPTDLIGSSDQIVELATSGFSLSIATVFSAGTTSNEEIAGIIKSVLIGFEGGAVGTNNDPNFASVSLLLHLDGGDGATTFPDSSGNSVAMTRVGAAVLTTSIKKFGTASVVWDGTADGLRTPNSTLFTFGTNDFTIEFWSYFNASFNTGLDARLVNIGASSERSIVYRTNKLLFRAGSLNYIIGDALNLEQWYHIALAKSGDNHRLFVDGIQVGATYSSSVSYTRDQITFGCTATNGDNYLGHMDEIRVTKGIARYTSNFAPPTQAFPDA